MPRRRQAEVRGQTGPLVTVNARVPHRLRQRVRLVCVEQGRDMQDFVTEAIRECLRRRQQRR